jgi:hypothetical protein
VGARDAWKRAERKVAQILGGRRVSSERLGRGGPDVEAGCLDIEVKYRSSLPMWLVLTERWIAQRKRQGRIAVKVIRIRGHSGGIAVMDLETFNELARRLGWNVESNP